LWPGPTPAVLNSNNYGFIDRLSDNLFFSTHSGVDINTIYHTPDVTGAIGFQRSVERGRLSGVLPFNKVYFGEI